mgnify:CR=1 FL=1
MTRLAQTADLTEIQREILSTVRSFVDREIIPHAQELEHGDIYPQEIENVFTLHPAVADIGVIGVPDAEMGERVVAFVEPAPGVEPSEALGAELATFARQHLSGFKVPREFHFRETLPRTPTGKMVKGKLRDEYASTVG